MRNWRACAVIALAALLAISAAACGASAGGGAAASSTPATADLLTTMPAGTQPVQSALWATYRDVNSLDPIYLFDYPESTADSLIYESLLRQAPDGSITPGLATLTYTDPTTLVFKLTPGIKFWDGSPVTPDDVVFSLKRNFDPALGGYYGAQFARVKSIEATGSDEVTVTLVKPDYWLAGELSSIPGMILEKRFTERQGKNYGTPAGAVMGTGSYKVESWDSSTGLTLVANSDYWNAAVKPQTQKIVLKGVASAASLSSGLLTGSIQGSYLSDLSTLRQLEKSPEVKIYQGVGWATESLAICNLKGVLGDVRARQALSLALDRQAEIDTVYQGSAQIPRWPSSPGNFAYGKAVFEKAYSASPEMTQDLAKAKQLAGEARVQGKTITIGMTNEMSTIAAMAAAYKSAGEAIGLKVKFKAVSAQNYIYFFVDPKARAGVDGFPTVNYGDYADPAALLSTIVLPDGSQNFSGYDNPQITSLLEQARGTADDNTRADLVSQAQVLAAQDLPWIPTAMPNVVLAMDSKLTGAIPSFAYLFSPWADQLGGTP